MAAMLLWVDGINDSRRTLSLLFTKLGMGQQTKGDVKKEKVRMGMWLVIYKQENCIKLFGRGLGKNKSIGFYLSCATTPSSPGAILDDIELLSTHRAQYNSLIYGDRNAMSQIKQENNKSIAQDIRNRQRVLYIQQDKGRKRKREKNGSVYSWTTKFPVRDI